LLVFHRDRTTKQNFSWM